MDGARDLAVFLAIVVGATVAAIRIGMLLAPRLDRLTTPNDEDDGAEPD